MDYTTNKDYNNLLNKLPADTELHPMDPDFIDAEYLTDKYKARSEAGRKGGLAKSENASSKTIAPIPIPRPIPNKQLLVAFDTFWEALLFKKGSKKLACQRYLKECGDINPAEVAA